MHKKFFYPSPKNHMTLSAWFALLNLLILRQETQGHEDKNHAPDPPDSVTEFARTVTRDSVIGSALRSSANQAGQFGQSVRSVQSVQSVSKPVNQPVQSVNQSVSPVQSGPVQSSPVSQVSQSSPVQSVSQSSQAVNQSVSQSSPVQSSPVQSVSKSIQ